jgi:hypothetical protein
MTPQPPVSYPDNGLSEPERHELEAEVKAAIHVHRRRLAVAQALFDRLAARENELGTGVDKCARTAAAYKRANYRLKTQHEELAAMLKRLGYVPRLAEPTRH